MIRTIPIAFLFIFLASCKINPSPAYILNEGFIYGTVYRINYESPKGKDFHNDIKKELNLLDYSFSTFNKESVISKINRNETVEADSHFVNVFKKSLEISEISEGAFDATVAPLVNAWGFGFEKKETITPGLIDSILNFVGYSKVRLAGKHIEKDDPRVMLDFSAIAKGYTVDVIGSLLEKKGCANYMVEIGGEVVAKGVNQKGVTWRIGINEPNDNESLVPQKLQAIIGLKNKAIATSGNYRNFYIENGRKYAHTINPHTGYPVGHNLLSASVLANNCMTADALATACMVLGIDKTMNLLSGFSGADFFLIYADSAGQHQVVYTEGFENCMIEH
ncbi:MAG: FAD:protein FMN transferase [Prolixibacteraceae bacterium]|nr:FAD:protein FMN transferase [Prolixibacteraceae bacterium]